MKRRLGVALAVASLTAGLLAITSGIVFAHSRPVRLDPAPGAVLQSAPPQVQGWFVNELRRDLNWNFIHVTDASGARVEAADTQLSADRRQMTVNLKAGLGPGRYMVIWSSWDDSDGEIFTDCYTFFVGQAAADQAVTEKTRLDGGAACPRFEFNARSGTPVPGMTPEAENEGASGEGADDSGDSGVPVWALVLGVAGGLALGLVGGRVVGQR